MHPVTHFWELILGTIVALLPIINPFAAAPVFLAITEGDSEERRREQARRGCLYMVLILVSFLMGGTFIMSFFGISIPGLRIAGGLLVCGIGLKMLGPLGEHLHASEREQEAARAKRDVSFTPLAMPQLSGPGSIAVTVGFTSLATHWLDYVAIILGIVVVALISYVTLRLASRVVKIIGVNGMSALTKIMGFLLLCVGIQFVVNGIIGIATNPELMKGVRDALAPSQ
jgi:multiple antibiotic resistance protein